MDAIARYLNGGNLHEAAGIAPDAEGLLGQKLADPFGAALGASFGGAGTTAAGAAVARVQLALDPAELVIRIPRDACQFYEFWRAGELIDIGRAEAEKALDAAGY